MGTRSAALILAVAVLSVSACGVGPHSGSTAGFSSLSGKNNAAGYVLSGPNLREHGGSLLSFLFGRVSGMDVDYSTYPCPSIQIRGRKSLVGSSDPIVYVDGARTANSCILEDLHTRDLSRVEVYPMGVANRPGYESHPNGLILVFIRNGPRDEFREVDRVVTLD